MSDLSKRCSVVTNKEEDHFVGIKIKHNSKVIVFFPLGFPKPISDDEARTEVLNLLQILKRFNENQKGVIQRYEHTDLEDSLFPILAYLDIIYYFLRNGYYIERERLYKVNANGLIDWKRTIHTQKPLIQDDEIIYTSFMVRKTTPDENRLVTMINKFCVYESFAKLGWLFTDFMPYKPKIEFNKGLFLSTVSDKLRNTNNDAKKKLFTAMLNIIRSVNERDNDYDFTYGTNRFEYVWERLVDYVFGIENKKEFFPRSKWRNLIGNHKKDKSPLEPDTIMDFNNRLYILDAKYYKYGVTAIENHLPPTSSIAKQITYGEYIDKNKNKPGYGEPYNAFIMPFNKDNNFLGLKELMGCIGEAVGEWRGNSQNPYERVQGIVIDIKYLMHVYSQNHGEAISDLARKIDEAVQKSKEINPINNYNDGYSNQRTTPEYYAADPIEEYKV